MFCLPVCLFPGDAGNKVTCSGAVSEWPSSVMTLSPWGAALGSLTEEGGDAAGDRVGRALLAAPRVEVELEAV